MPGFHLLSVEIPVDDYQICLPVMANAHPHHNQTSAESACLFDASICLTLIGTTLNKYTSSDLSRVNLDSSENRTWFHVLHAIKYALYTIVAWQVCVLAVAVGQCIGQRGQIPWILNQLVCALIGRLWLPIVVAAVLVAGRYLRCWVLNRLSCRPWTWPEMLKCWVTWYGRK